MVVLWTCGDIFKTLYFLLRDAPVQFWVCGSMQVAIDLLILLQVFLYRGNSDAGRPVSHRIDWVVVRWTHEESRLRVEPSSTEVKLVDETLHANLDNGRCFDTSIVPKSCISVSADIHSEVVRVHSLSSDNVSKSSDNTELRSYDQVNGCCSNGDQLLQNVMQKKSSKVSIFIHRHTLWRRFNRIMRLPLHFAGFR